MSKLRKYIDISNIRRKKLRVLSMSLVIIGVMIFSYPFYSGLYYKYKAYREKEKFLSNMNTMSDEEINKLKSLYESLESGFDKKGGSIVDPFDIEKYRAKNPISVKDGIIGYITIPKINVDHPIYIGANEENLMKGMAQVEGTSLPIGEIGSRCVIAGHRGTYRSGPMFRHLDKLKKGDEVYVTSLKETLKYRVKDIQIILPSDNDKLLPKKDEDILTLLTCHPYPLNKQRLIVNCERIN